MRTIRTKVYQFNELLIDNQQNAIEQIRESYCDFNDFAEWAIDDCNLLNPPYKEIQKYNLKDGILLSNNRKNIYFSTDRNWYLDCEKAISVKDEHAFFDWLGIPKKLAKKTDYEIYTPSSRNAGTKIEFTHLENLEFTDSEQDYL
jgi:hypothetical protein